jgi:hypothetical protein
MRQANIVKEYGPFPGIESVHGVTYDGENVWLASGDKLNAFDPANGKINRSIGVPAHTGAAFDGQHLYQIAEARIQKINPGTNISGLESDGRDQFFCGGGKAGRCAWSSAQRPPDRIFSHLNQSEGKQS